MNLVRKFKEYFLLLSYFTRRQPSRGEEVAGLRLANGINRDRNVFIIDGKVVLVTQYHKSLAHFDSPKVISRFLPERVGQLMVMYMVYSTFLKLTKQLSSQPALKRKGAADVRELTPLKRPKLLRLEKLDSEAGKD